MRKLEKRARTVFTPEGRKAAGLFGAYLGVLASSAFLSEPFCAPSELSSRSPERIPLRSSELDQDRGIPNMQLILDKLTLPFEQPRLSRPRLLGLLQSSLNSCTSTIINGRAGTGKTLLAADFARRSGRRVAWYKVNASDGDLRVFFPYLIESVRRQGGPASASRRSPRSSKLPLSRTCRCWPKLSSSSF
jgi:hypothetical protein